MSPTSRNARIAARARARNQPPPSPPCSAMPVLFFKPLASAALTVLPLAIFLVILHSWQAQGQFQDNSLANLANHIWQPALDLRQQQQQQRQVNANSPPNSIEQSANQNAIGLGTQQQAYQILEQQQQLENPPLVKRNEFAKLERRIDRLEFELRKSLHQMQSQHNDNSLNSISNEIASSQGTDLAATAANNGEGRQNNQQQPTTTTTMSMIDLSERLNLVERFITITTTKMYELEGRIKQLDKCECQISCKWSVPGATREALKSDAKLGGTNMGTQRNDETQSEPSRQSKFSEPMRGQQHGAARFQADEDDFMNNAGSHLHSNGSSSPFSSTSSSVTLVKRDGQVWHDKCNICSCHDGRFQCQRINIVAPATTTTTRNGVVSSRLQREARPDANLHNSNEHGNNLQQDGRRQESNYDTDDLGRESDKLIASDNYEDTDDDTETGGNELHGADENSIGGGRGNDENNDEETPNWHEQNRAGRRQRRGLTGSRPARRVSRTLSLVGDAAGPLFCPPTNCADREQIRLENDCCTYCADFDFCALPWRHHHHTPTAAAAASRCHPNAICKNTLQRLPQALSLSRLATNESSGQAESAATGSNGSQAQQAQMGEQPLRLRSINSMFSCECKPGFRGDGLSSCDDIDECADDRLHDCDLKTTRCVNLAGSYECRCKRGFKPTATMNAAAAPLIETGGDQSSVDGTIESQARLMRVSVPAGERRLLQRCKDVDECQDGKLNRCHPQARCINVPGAYKCQCKRGYLGNGFECHKWFTSGPNVAAYLYRHEGGAASDPQDDDGDDYGDDDEDDDELMSNGSDGGQGEASARNSTQQMQQQQRQPVRQASVKKSSSSGGGGGRLTRVSKRVNLPLNTLDEDDDQDDDRTDMIAYLDDSSSAAADQFEPEADGDNDNGPDAAQVPKLSESKWESLKYSAESFNQQQAYASSQALNLRSAKSNATSLLDGGDQQRQAEERATSSINTRTMFLQPPPRIPRPRPWWDEPETSTTSTMTTPARSGPNVATNVANRITSIETATSADGNHGSPTLATADSGANKSSVRPQQQQRQNPQSIPVTESGVLSTNKKLPIGYKKGTIIASASSSPRKGTLAAAAAAASGGGSGNGIVANERAYSSSQQQPFRSQQMPASSSGSASSNIITPSHRFNIIMTTAMTTTTATATWLQLRRPINIWTQQMLAHISMCNPIRGGTYLLSLAMVALSFTLLYIHNATIF